MTSFATGIFDPLIILLVLNFLEPKTFISHCFCMVRNVFHILSTPLAFTDKSFLASKSKLAPFLRCYLSWSDKSSLVLQLVFARGEYTAAFEWNEIEKKIEVEKDGNPVYLYAFTTGVYCIWISANSGLSIGSRICRIQWFTLYQAFCCASE